MQQYKNNEKKNGKGMVVYYFCTLLLCYRQCPAA